MPNIKSAEKRARQNLKLRDHNRQVKGTVKKSVKSFQGAVKEGDKYKAEQAYRKFVKLIDTAAGKKIYHKNTAARKKSRLQKILTKMQ